VLFIWATFERDHCSNADVTAGLCVSGNTAGTGLGDNYPEPRTGTPPSTTSNNQLTARVVGPVGTINKQNALVIGGTPSGDTRFINISTSPQNSPAGTAFFSVSSFHIVLFENEINTLLGGAASGTVSITLPDTSVPSNAGDDALLMASVFQNVEQTPTGFVRNATASAQLSTGLPGNTTLSPAAYDAGQAPDEADDGKLVMGASSSTEGFLTPAGHVALATLSVTNASGNYDTPNGNIHNEPNGFTGGAYFRNGGATPNSLYGLQMGGVASTLVYGATNASFLLESDSSDAGDAPLSYGNPTHTIVNNIRLGASVDADTGFLNSSNATGDDTNGTDDEDGVTMPSLSQGQSARISVNVNQVTAGTGRLQGWIDWNGDGDFTDVGEQIATNLQLSTGTSGTISVLVPVPSNAITTAPTYARFRWSTTADLTPTATATDGEVEDYQVSITTPAPNLGSCPATAYISQGADNSSIKLNSVNLQSGVLTPISASNFAAGVNAIGFNQLDGYIYGMKGGIDNTVMRIDANGVGYDLGAIPGLPLADYNAGDVDANGILYVRSATSTTAYGIDVKPASLTYLTIVKTITGLILSSDFAFHPTNGKLYTIQDSTGNVYEISWPAAGASVAATLVNRGKPTNLPIGTYGAVYFASDGSMYGYSNGTAGSNNGAIYRMTNVVGIGLPVATTLTTTAAGVSSNDGARCPLAPPVTAPTSKAKLILVKRITAIKDGITVSPLKDAVGVTISFSGFVDDTTSTRKTDDNNCNWPTATGITGACTNTYTIGATTETAPKVKPGDEIEYTIYYLNAGENKATARVCDRLSPNLTFQPDFDASNVAKGIGFNPGGTGITYLTNLGTDDKGQLTDASVTNCNLPSNAGTEVVAVDVGDATTPLLGSTGAGVPTSSYGYIRFKAVVK
jgi:uncharacterized repeat protein (TIGR01451 family)